MNRLLQHGTQWLQRSRRKVATAAIGVLLCLIGYHAVFGANGFLVFQQKRIESKKLEWEIQTLKLDNARNQHEIQALKSDPQAIEKEARERLHYAREGEKIFKLPPAKPSKASPK
jgi:cell division protein FtsB